MLGRRPFTEFYQDFFLPSEAFDLIFFKAKIAILCTKGFEIMDLTEYLYFFLLFFGIAQTKILIVSRVLPYPNEMIPDRRNWLNDANRVGLWECSGQMRTNFCSVMMVRIILSFMCWHLPICYRIWSLRRQTWRSQSVNGDYRMGRHSRTCCVAPSVRAYI